MSWPLPRVDVERSPCTSKLGAALPLSTESGPSWHPTVAGDVQSKWVWRALSGLYHLREWTSRLITATARSKLYLARLKCIVETLSEKPPHKSYSCVPKIKTNQEQDMSWLDTCQQRQTRIQERVRRIEPSNMSASR